MRGEERRRRIGDGMEGEGMEEQRRGGKDREGRGSHPPLLTPYYSLLIPYSSLFRGKREGRGGHPTLFTPHSSLYTPHSLFFNPYSFEGRVEVRGGREGGEEGRGDRSGGEGRVGDVTTHPSLHTSHTTLLERRGGEARGGEGRELEGIG